MKPQKLKPNDTCITLLMSAQFGAIAALGFAPFQLFWAPLLGYFGLYQILQKQASWTFFAFFVSYFSVGTPWIFNSLKTFGHLSPMLAFGLTILAIIIFAAIGELIWSIRRINFKPFCILSKSRFWFAFAIVAAEWVRSYFLFSGFPWLILGTSQLHGPFAFLLPVIGSFGTSWFVAVLIVLGAYCLEKKNHTKHYLFYALLLLLLILPSVIKHHWTKPLKRPIHLAAIKVLPTGTSTQTSNQLTSYLEQSKGYWQKNDLLIWPESALPVLIDEHPNYIRSLKALGHHDHTTLLSGTFTHKGQNIYNTMIGIGQKSVYKDRKHKLVAFGEYYPLPIFIKNFLAKHDIPVSNLTQDNTPPKTLLLPGGIKILPLICYEIAFPSWVRKYALPANLLVSVHKMTWFQSKQASYQQLEMAKARSLETGKPQVFMSLFGPIATIDDQGKIIEMFPEDQFDKVQTTITPRKGHTPYSQLGELPWFIPALVLLLL